MRVLWEVLVMAFQALKTNRMRTILTLLGVILGVTSVITIISAIEGLGQSIEAEVNRLGPTTFVISKWGFITSEDAFWEALKRKPLKYDYVEAIEEGCSECNKIGAYVVSRASVKYRNRKVSRVAIIGATSNYIDIVEYEVAGGRFHSPEDDNRRRRVAFIGSGIVEELYPNVDPIGKTIKLNNIKYTVIGVAKSQGSTFGHNRDNIVFIPFFSLVKDLDVYEDDLDLIVSAKSIETMDFAMDQVRIILRAFRHVPYDKPDDFAMLTADNIIETFNRMTQSLKIGLVGITSISIVVGGIIIMNIMMISVTERTREIGIRKSIGAKQKHILLQFLFEALVLSLGGGLVGIAIGVVLGDLLIGLIDINMTPSLFAIGLGLGISSGTGLFFGIYPALKAARLEPVKALSYE